MCYGRFVSFFMSNGTHGRQHDIHYLWLICLSEGRKQSRTVVSVLVVPSLCASSLKMFRVIKEQCVNVKYLVKLGKSAKETNSLLRKVYKDECLSRNFWKGKSGSKNVETRLKTIHVQDDLQRQRHRKILIRKDRLLSVCAVAEIVGIDKESARWIFHEKSLFKTGAKDSLFWTESFSN